MWWIVLFTSLLLFHKGASQLDYFQTKEEKYNIVGIFEKTAVVQTLAFNNSCNTANQDGLNLNATIIIPTRSDSYSVWKDLCKNDTVSPIAIFGPQNAISDVSVRDHCAIVQIPHLQAAWQPFDPFLEQIATDEEETAETELEEAEEKQEGDEETSEDTNDVEKAPVYKKITINFYPNADEIALAYSALLRHYKWTKFAALYEDDYGLLRIQKILAEHSTEYTIFVRKLDPNGKNHEIFKGLKDYKTDRILLDCHADRILTYMRVAEEMGIVNVYYHFIFVSLDGSIDASELIRKPCNTTWLSMTDFDKINDTQHFLASKVPHWTPNKSYRHVTDFQLESLLMADIANHVIHSVKAILNTTDTFKEPSLSICQNDSEIIPWTYGAAFQDQILKLNTTGVTGHVQFDETGKRVNYTLYVNEIYMHSRNTIGQWSSLNPDNIEGYDKDAARINATEISTKHFIIISRKAQPYFSDKEPCVGDNCTEEDTGEKYEGFAVDLVHAIFKVMREEFKLNYTFEFVHTTDDSYGSYDTTTKKWTGLIGDLLDKKADLAVCDLTITQERKKVVDFSVPFMTLGISILYTQGHKVDPGMFSFLNPYTFDVWMHTATAYCIVSMFLFVCARLSPEDWENPQPCDKDPEELENIWNFKNCTWLTLGSIMTQGCDILPKALGSRWVCAMWWFFAVIVCQTYIAQLSASMTSALENEPINSVEDLAKQTKIRYGALKGGSTLSFFRNSKDKMYQTMYENMMANDAVLVSSNEEGENRVVNGRNKYAFFMESATIEYKLKRNCGLKKVGGQLDSKDYGIAMPANSPFRTHINRAILKLKENTQLDKIKQIWWNEKYNATECPPAVDENDVEGDLEMKNLIGAFVVLIFGLFVCLFITAAEFMDEVRNIVVQEELSHKEAFIKELKASLNFFQLQKPVLRNPSRAPSVISDKSQLDNKQARRAQALENFMDLEKMVQ